MSKSVRYEGLPSLVAAVALIPVLYLASLRNYLLFHSLVEIMTITVAFALLVLTWNARRFLGNSCLNVLGIGYGCIAVIDLVHTLSYKGMNVFPGLGANVPTQLWIAARSLQAVTLLLVPLFVRRKMDLRVVLGVYVLAVAGILVAVFGGHFPVCYIEGKGLTQFKIVSEYVISAVLVVSLYLFHRRRNRFHRRIYTLLVASIILTIVSEISFTAYVSVYGAANMLGHITKLAAFYLVYQAILVTGFQEPFDLIFRDLKEASEDLRTARDNLQAVNHELESFSYSVSHDLRAPIRHINGFLGLFRERVDMALDEKSKHYLDCISSAATHMASLIDDLLSFSRMGRVAMSVVPLDLGCLVRDAIRELEPEAVDRRIHWNLGDLPLVIGDVAMLRVVMTNLISNALKFTRSRELSEIEIGCQPGTNAEVVVFVRDNGAGFDPAYAGKLFNVFERLHPASEFEGTGVGLATVRQVIQRHGGLTWAEGAVDRGATFYFSLPDQRPGKVGVDDEGGLVTSRSGATS